MSNILPEPGDESTWGRCTGHPHDPRTETEEDFWDVCIDDDVFTEDTDLHEDEEGDDPLDDK